MFCWWKPYTTQDFLLNKPKICSTRIPNKPLLNKNRPRTKYCWTTCWTKTSLLNKLEVVEQKHVLLNKNLNNTKYCWTKLVFVEQNQFCWTKVIGVSEHSTAQNTGSVINKAPATISSELSRNSWNLMKFHLLLEALYFLFSWNS